MRIALLGQQAFGKAALDAFLARGHEVAGVFCLPDAPGAKPDPLKTAALERGLKLFQFASLRSPEAHAAMTSLKADLGVMAYVTQFAPATFTSTPRLGTIQYHPSLLPKYRGPSSINWAIVRGERRTGLSIFRPVDALDEGPVILQKACDIGPDETLGELYFNKLFPMGIEALLEAAEAVFAGTHTETAQSDEGATYEGWLKERESMIHWGNHVDVIYDLIRGCNPAPGAWTAYQGRRIHIFDCRKHSFKSYSGLVQKVGHVVEVGESSFKVAAQGGLIEVLKCRVEGSPKQNGGELARGLGWAGKAVLDGAA
ncbi:MAG: methionyl-tRNA formyltransferase [Elusimicrobiota bacterium]|nr:methionyl-tRNA formyltransferase [Elusimicrobiota bacterium]